MEFMSDGRIKVDPPKKPKKCTATRFASVMGLNDYSTPFLAWCEMTRTYEKPFEDSIYTIAGKAIEPKVCEYLRSHYFTEFKSPTDVYGPDYFKKTWGDFFPNVEALGGMWDFLGDDLVIEVKTTNIKNIGKWKDSDGKPTVPIYYKLQACLYAYLLGFDDIIVTCSFLENEDYTNPENFEVDLLREENGETVGNTLIVDFKLSEEFPNFKKDYIDPTLEFWRDHVLTGVSPQFDEKKDAEILKVLRKNVTEAKDADIVKLMKEGDRLKASIDKAKAKIADKEKRLKEIDEAVKKSMISQLRDGDKHVEIKGSAYTWDVRRDVSKSFDQKKFEEENPGVYEKYKTKETVKYVLTKKLIEEA